MKLLFSILVVTIIITSTYVFFNKKAADYTYEFCNLHATGNSLEAVKKIASEYQFKLVHPDSTRLLYVKTSELPMGREYGCEISFESGLVSEQNFLSL